MVQIYRKLPVVVSMITAIVLSLFVSIKAQPVYAAGGEGESPDLNNCRLLINGQEWTVFGVDTRNPSAGISMDDLNITLQGENGQSIDSDQYIIEVKQHYWDEDTEVTEDAAEPYGVLKDSEKNGKDGFTSYAVTAIPVQGSSYIGQKEADFIVCDKYCLNYVGGDNISLGEKYKSNESNWNRMYSAGYYRLPTGVGEEALQMMDITGAAIPDGSCTVTYFKRFSGEAIKDILEDYNMDRQEYIKAIWPETEESRLNAFPTEAGTYFAKVEAKAESPYYGTVIIDFDIMLSSTAELYAIASDGRRYSGRDGEVLSIDPKQKIFVVFKTGYEENLELGLAPLVGFHDCIEENGELRGDLSDVGFKLTNGTVKDLGYSGKIKDADDEDFGLEIDGSNLNPGTTGSLRFFLYPYEGDDFWRDFANGTFTFGNDPAEGYVKELKVVVTEHQWNNVLTKATAAKDGMITKLCKICGKTETLKIIPHPVKYTFAAKKYIYDGSAKAPVLTITDAEGSLITAANYSVEYGNNVNAGTAKARITFKGNYSGSVDKSFTIAKTENPVAVKGRTATLKYSKLKKKAQTLAVTNVIKFTKDTKDKKTYALSTAKKGSKSFKKYFSINKSTGKVTVKKGLKKGTYKVKVKVKALGNKNYKASTVKTVTFKVKVQ